ncbi:MAG: GNAT family N-acetyltransferase [Sumerlaeia bacterium]
MLTAPQLLSEHHDTAAFACGEAELDDFLRKRALKNQESGASRTYVVCDETRRVIAYYSLAVGSIAHAEVPGKVRRNMPQPIPVMILGRLAVDQSGQGQGLGKALLRDAILRTLQAAGIAGIRAIVVHAISEPAKPFYERCGFTASPLHPMTLMITLKEARAAL